MPRPISYAVFCLKKKTAQAAVFRTPTRLHRSAVAVRAPQTSRPFGCGSEQPRSYSVFFFIDAATTVIYTLSLHDALPILLTALVLVAALRLAFMVRWTL